ncbi:MAG: amidohydrolase family protein, partial [Candidatus Hydrogenedentota bacterium]
MRFGMVLSFLVVGLAAWGAEFETPLAITNVTLIPAPTRSVSGATIVIEDGRIKAVGASISAPSDARVIDGQGLYAYAGFIDGASHVGVPDAKPSKEELDRLLDVEQDVRQGPPTGMQLANRNGVWPHRTIRDVYTPDSDALERWRKAGFTAALVTSHPAILGGTGDVVQLSGAPLRRAVLASDVTQIVSFRSVFGEEFTPAASYPGSVMGVVAMIRQAFMDAEWYRQQHALYERYPNQVERPLHDPVLEAMGALVDRNQALLFNANTKSEIHHALDLAQEFNQRLIILGGKEAWKAKERLAAERVPVILSLHWEKKPKLAPNAKKEDSETHYTTVSWTPEWEDDFFEPLGVRKERVRLWEEEVDGIRALIAAGVDVGITGREAKNAEELWKKLRDALELGLSKDDLLAALTTNPARILGIDGQLGTVEPGKIADLALFTQPIEDKKAKLRYAIIDGELFEYSVTAKPEKKEGETEDDAAQGDEKSVEEEDEGDSEKKETDTKPPVDKHPFAFETEADRAPGLHTGGTVLLKNATVVTVTGGTLSSNDIAVVEGKIHQIGPNLGAPEGAAVIDLTGYWVMPGIVDPHSHIGSGGGINEYTQSITCEVRMADAVDDSQEELHRALAGGVTTIHLMHGSANAIGGENAVLKLKRNTTPQDVLVTTGPRLVKFALGENPTRANSQQRGRRFPGTRMGVEAVIRQGFNDALEYRKAWQEYAEETAQGEIVLPPRRDLRLEALSDILRGEIWVHSHCYRADEILRLLNVAQDYGFQIACLQ